MSYNILKCAQQNIIYLKKKCKNIRKNIKSVNNNC